MSDSGRAERVQKVLAAAGLGSRRQCEALIRAGRVSVNGRTARLGDRADPSADILVVDGVRVQADPGLVHYMLNKPRGVVTTLHDPEGRPTVADYVTTPPRVFPVGRLDADTEGLLLLTNDGPLAQRLTHPRYGVPKTYVARVRGTVRRHTLRALAEGVQLDDGVAAAASVRTLATAKNETLLELVVTEGRNRLIRRMLSAVGLSLERLARVQLGPLALGDIGQGRVRPLTGREVRELYRAVRLGAPDADRPAASTDDDPPPASRTDDRPRAAARADDEE